MKFFRIIMALCVLVSAQNGLFGLAPRRASVQTGQGMDKKALQAKEMKLKAMIQLQEYINTYSINRNKNDIANAEQALKVITSAKKTSPLTEDEARLLKDVIGQLPNDKARLEMGTQPKQQPVKSGEQELGSGQLPSLENMLQKLSTKDLSAFYVNGQLNIDAVASAVRELRNVAPANTR